MEHSKIKNKLLVWMNMPSHHQSGFFDALRKNGFDLEVRYYGKVSSQRRKEGWEDYESLPDGEVYVPPDLGALTSCPDWRNRIHIVPGARTKFLRKLVGTLSLGGVAWLHWSERSHSGARWFLSYPLKRWYANKINRFSLGALAIGELAKLDFKKWGVQSEKIYLLPYSIPALPPINEVVENHCDSRSTTRPYLTFLYLGRLSREKGADLVLEAAKNIITKTGMNFRLLLVGKMVDDVNCEKFIKQNDIKGWVKVFDPVPSHEINRVIDSADVVIVPSRYDGWGMVLNEAASMGKALISTTSCGGAFHLIEDGVNGYRVNIKRQDALEEAMLQYINFPEKAAMHGNISLEKFRSFSPTANVTRLSRVLEEVQRGDQ